MVFIQNYQTASKIISSIDRKKFCDLDMESETPRAGNNANHKRK